MPVQQRPDTRLAEVVDISRPLVAREHFTFSLPPGRLHFAAHSHHPRPDVTRHAVLECWDDAARLQSAKWQRVLGEVLPEAQQHIARLLGLPDPEMVAFATNTHEFVVRLLSCFDPKRPVRLLTSDSEFHSFGRQIRRSIEQGTVIATMVPARPFADFEARFAAAALKGDHDLIFLSQVHFNSGYRLRTLSSLVGELSASGATVVVDGYHGFMAVPESLGEIADDCFYMAGGYKYAMSGEGACFLTVPAGCELKPGNTSWFADFAARGEVGSGPVGFAGDGYRFAGSIFDPAGLYRFNASMRLLHGLGVGVAEIHSHVRALQALFIRAIGDMGHPVVNRSTLIPGADVTSRGNFLAFEHDGAAALCDSLREQGVTVDARGRIIRFGFGVYHSGGDVARLVDILDGLH